MHDIQFMLKKWNRDRRSKKYTNKLDIKEQVLLENGNNSYSIFAIPIPCM